MKKSLRDTPGSMLLSPKTTMRRELVARVEGCLYLYSPSFLEGEFSETQGPGHLHPGPWLNSVERIAPIGFALKTTRWLHERDVDVVVVEREVIDPEWLEYPARTCPHGPPSDNPIDQWRVRVVEHELEDALAKVKSYRIASPTKAPNVEGI